MELAGRFACADRDCAREVHGPRVQAGVHLHDADAGLGIAGEHGALDRRRAAPARQQRRVQVDTAHARPVEPLAGQQQPIRDDDHEVRTLAGRRLGGPPQRRGLRERQAELERDSLDRRRREAAAPAGRAVGLREHERDASTRRNDGTKRRNREVGSSGECYSGFGVLSLHRAGRGALQITGTDLRVRASTVSVAARFAFFTAFFFKRSRFSSDR